MREFVHLGAFGPLKIGASREQVGAVLGGPDMVNPLAAAAPEILPALTRVAGPRDGEVSGHLCGNELYHASLAPDEYRTLLAASGFEVLRYREEDPECGGHTVWFAQAVK